MKNSPKISVIIPSYNAEKYIKKTLDSIFDQKYPLLEVIVQDGGSTDDTINIIKVYSKKYVKQLIYETKKDKGQADAINKGIKKASGEILTYINADDNYTPGALQHVADSYCKNPQALWYAGKGKVIDKNGAEISRLVTLYKNLFLRLNNFIGLLTFNYLMQPSVFLTREGLKKINEEFASIDGIVMEYESWLKLGKLQMPVVINEYLSEFRMSGNNFSSTQFGKVLSKDEKIVRKYTRNPLVLVLHKLNNLGRYFVLQSLK